MEKRYGYLSEEDYQKADRNGLKRKTVFHRVYNANWDVERAVTQPVVQRYTKEQKRLMKENNVSKNVMYHRLRKGMTLEDAISRPFVEHKHESAIFTHSELDQLKANGIRLSTAINRVRRGWEKERAINKPAKSNRPVSKEAIR